MPEIMVKPRVRKFQTLRCVNPKCGSKNVKHYIENVHYHAWKCHECGHFVVEGDVDKFCDDYNEALARRRGQELGPALREAITRELENHG